MNKLTEPEEETMQVVWQIGGGFVKEVLDELPEPKPPYTTLASTLKNLEKKNFVTGEKLGNSYRYQPKVKAEDYKKWCLKHFVGDYFRNSYKDMVAFFVEEKQLSPAELQEILDMIENRKPE